MGEDGATVESINITTIINEHVTTKVDVDGQKQLPISHVEELASLGIIEYIGIENTLNYIINY